MPIADPVAQRATDDAAIAARKRAMALLARALTPEMAEPVERLWPTCDARDLKPVETGLVMLRGRIGGDGAPFNVGEATVTRAVVELPSGERGYAHVLGRDAGARAARRRRRRALAEAGSARRCRGGDSRADRRTHRGRESQDARRDRGDPRRLLHPRCAARTAHDRARFRRSRFRLAGGFPPDHARDGRAGDDFSLRRGAGAAGAARARRRGGLADAGGFRDAAVDRAVVRRGERGRRRRLSHVPHRRAARAFPADGGLRADRPRRGRPAARAFRARERGISRSLDDRGRARRRTGRGVRCGGSRGRASQARRSFAPRRFRPTFSRNGRPIAAASRSAST